MSFRIKFCVVPAALLGIFALGASAVRAADSVLTTYWATSVNGDSEYIERTTPPFALDSGYYVASNAAGASATGSGFARIYDGVLGGRISQNTESGAPSTIYNSAMEVTLEDRITLTGPGSSPIPVQLSMNSRGFFTLDTVFNYQFVSLRSYFNLSNLTVPATERADLYWEKLNNGAWDKYSDIKTAGATVQDFGLDTAYSAQIRLTVMAKPGDKLLVYSAVESYLMGRGATSSIDFSHTADLQISLPAGYSFTSSSGQFLQAVPEPASLSLFAVGLIPLLKRQRRVCR